jgi:hypothetical protein
VQAHWDRVSQDRNAQMESTCLNGGADQCRANVAEMQRDLGDLQGAGGDFNKGISGLTPEERNNIKQVMAQTRTNLEVMAQLGNQQLGTTYASPSDLVAAGILTEQEGDLLEAARAGSMVNFLGAVVLPSGVKANPVRTAGKTTQQEVGPISDKVGSSSPTKGDTVAAETKFKTAHYAPRLEAAGVNVARAEAAVANEVQALRGKLATNADVVGRLTVDGVKVEYRARLLPDGTINVGTLFPVK